MNWTEGNLVRHSRGRQGKNKEIRARQREHFAKARASLLSSNVKTSPPSISFLAHQANASPPVHHRASSVPRKRTQDDRPSRTSRFFEDTTVELPSPAEFQQAQIEEEALRRKRQKLLLKGDWVGTNVQKPIGISFPKPRASNSNPWGFPHSQSSKQRLRHILGVRNTNGLVRTAETAAHLSQPVSRSHLRIRIGSQERTIRGSSSGSSGSRTTRYNSSIHAPFKNIDRRNDHARNIRYRKTASHSSPLSSGSNGNPDAAGTPVNSSPRRLFQPQPARPCFPQLIHASSDSGNAGSTTARVGHQKPAVSASQLGDNEAWREFVAGAIRGRDLSDSESHEGNAECPVQMEISPGPSQFGLSIPADRTHAESPIAQLQSKAIAYEEQLDAAPDMDPVDTITPVPNLQSGQSESSLSHEESSGQDVPSHEPSNTMWQAERDDRLEFSIEPGESSRRAEGPSSGAASEDSVLYDALSSFPEQANSVAASTHSTRTAAEDSASLLKITEQQGQTMKANISKAARTEDQNDIWRMFVFGEAQEDLDKVFDEVRRETARNLRPSDRSTATEQTNVQDHGPNQYADLVPAFGVLDSDTRFDMPEFTATDNATSPTASTTSAFLATISHVAIPALSSPDPLAAPALSSPDPLAILTAKDLDANLKTDQATNGSSYSPSVLPEQLFQEFQKRSEVWSAATNEKDSLPSMANSSSNFERDESEDPLINKLGSVHEMDPVPLTASPLPQNCIRKIDGTVVSKTLQPKTKKAEANFIFAKPKPFTGEKLRHVDEKSQIALSAPQIRGKPQNRRRQKRTTDGRTRIRKLPNSNSDPIEDIEDDFSRRHNQPPSLFGSLDVEADFEA